MVRSLATRDANGSWAREVEGNTAFVGAVGDMGGDAGDVGELRPATNITGANWARSSIGYEFMVAERH